jgi:hypothetical protein
MNEPEWQAHEQRIDARLKGIKPAKAYKITGFFGKSSRQPRA